MPKYILCPRCELNYIKEGEEYCDVCKAQLKKGPQLIFAVDEEEEQDVQELCSICHHNYIKAGETMCAKCAEEMDFKKGDVDIDKDEEWKNFLDDDADEKEEDNEEMLSLNRLAEEEGSDMFKDEDAEEEEEELTEPEIDPDPDDFEIPSIDASDFEDTDDEEEDSEEDDYDDDDDDDDDEKKVKKRK